MPQPRPAPLVCTVLFVVSALVGVSTAEAQAPTPTAPQTAATPVRSSPASVESKWMIDAHVGGARVGQPTAGTSVVPAAGPTVALPLGQITRRVSSWYFGDGAALIGQANAQHMLSPTSVTSLDPVIASSAAQRQNGAAFGVRVSRALGTRVRAEFAVDVADSGLAFTSAAQSGIAASRASFQSFWASFVTLGFSGPSVTSVATFTPGSTREILTTADLRIDLKKTAKNTWCVTLGGGLLHPDGMGPSATLAGNYQFTVNGIEPFSETDTVTIHGHASTRAVGVVGGGWTHALSSRIGLRADALLYLGRSGITTTIDATPTRALIENRSNQIALTTGPTVPVLEFYNGTDEGGWAISSLSAAAVKNFTTFTGSGLQSRVAITAGLYVRF
jgi:hypothetical protein